MRRRILLLAALGLMGGCGQSPIQHAARVMTETLPTEAAPQFRAMTHNDAVACGEFNVRDTNGAETGYRRFIHNRVDDRILVDPGQHVPQGLRDSLGSLSAAIVGKDEFDMIWSRNCVV